MKVTSLDRAPSDLANRVMDVALVLPDQIAPSDAVAQSGEHRLLLAILCEALTTALRERLLSSDQTSAASRARTWIESNVKGSGFFSFVEVCDHLGINPDWLRGTVRRAWAEGQGVRMVRAMRPRTYRVGKKGTSNGSNSISR